MRAAQEEMEKKQKAKKVPEPEPDPAVNRMVPMTKEAWEKQQSVIRKVYDPDTGRHRLVKGDGEIIEEIVSYSRHKQINQTATRGDGASFQGALNAKIAK